MINSQLILLDVMARAHIEKEIVTNISGIIKKQSDELNMETGITSSLDDSEIARLMR